MTVVSPVSDEQEAAARWGEEIDGEIVYPLHEAQSAVIAAGQRQRPPRFILACAGTGGGKTALGPLWLLTEIDRVIASGRDLSRTPYSAMVVAPTFKILRKATLEEFLRVFARSPYAGRFIEGKGVYILPNNIGKVWVHSADIPEGLEGGQCDSVWGDEGGQMKYKAWVALLGRVGVREGRILLTTTPYAFNWLKYWFYDKWKAGDQDFHVVQWESIANPAYSRSSFELAKRTMSDARFQMRYRGLFTRPSGLVYPDLESTCKRSFNRVPDGLKYGGMDFGFSPDPFAAVVGVVDPGGALWIFYLRYKAGELISEHAEAMKRAGVCYGVKYWCDSADPESRKELRKAGFSVYPNKIQKRYLGFDAVNKRVYAGKLFIEERAVQIFQEAAEYMYPEEDDVVVGDEPVGRHHALDGMRYLIANLDKTLIANAA